MEVQSDNRAVIATWSERDVFVAALSLPPSELDEFLNSHCPDEASRQRIRILLHHHKEAPENLLSFEFKTTDTPDEPQIQIDEFKLVRRLGEGGMGEVFLAEDTILRRKVALKLLARHLTGSERAITRFQEEARNAAKLDHPAIVKVFQFGKDGEDSYLVSEFVDGPTLSSVIAEQCDRLLSAGTIDLKEWYRRSAQIVLTIAQALECAHGKSVLHRDVKPSNILMDRQHGPRLTDFGIAKDLDQDDRTQTAVVGTYHYMSPEQAGALAEPVDPRSDIFSLGVVLYEMLALRRPFDGYTPPQVLRAIGESAPTPLRAMNRRIPVDLETICQKAMEKRPRDRYPTAAHFAADLQSFLSGEPIMAKPPSLLRRARRLVGRHRAWAAIAAIAVLSTAIGALVWQLKTAGDDRVAWISIESDASPLNVYVQSVDSASGQIVTEARYLGRTPLDSASLPMGLYRITAASEDGRAFAEFDVPALDGGRARGHQLRVVAKREDVTSSSPAALHLTAVLADPKDLAADMATIPAGEYLTGQDGQAYEKTAARRVYLPAFLIDRYQVSNREYKEFADRTGRSYPSHWGGALNAEWEDLPATGMTLGDCEAYARSRGKRLATLLEWQAAARGPEGRLYPWGNSKADAPPEFTDYSVDLAIDQSRDAGDRTGAYARYAKSVRAYDALTCTRDLFHVFGPVREITSTIDADRRNYIVMGRCWADHPRYVTLAEAWSVPLSTGVLKNGFRCAKSLSPPFKGVSLDRDVKGASDGMVSH